MTSTGTYLAVFLGSKSNPRMAEWMVLPEAERKAKEQKGMAAWKAWMEKHQAAVVGAGGPLGRTKRVSGRGTADVANEMGAFTVVRAESHAASCLGPAYHELLPASAGRQTTKCDRLSYGTELLPH